jgi:hypothetical protein
LWTNCPPKVSKQWPFRPIWRIRDQGSHQSVADAPLSLAAPGSGQASLRNYVYNLNTALAGKGVYAGALTLGVLTERSSGFGMAPLWCQRPERLRLDWTGRPQAAKRSPAPPIRVDLPELVL